MFHTRATVWPHIYDMALHLLERFEYAEQCELFEERPVLIDSHLSRPLTSFHDFLYTRRVHVYRQLCFSFLLFDVYFSITFTEYCLQCTVWLEEEEDDDDDDEDEGEGDDEDEDGDEEGEDTVYFLISNIGIFTAPHRL